MLTPKSSTQKREMLFLCLCFFHLFLINQLSAAGTPQLAPTNTDSISLFINSNNYYNFARYGSTDAQRLYINITNPESEQVFLGFSRPIADGHYPGQGFLNGYFRIIGPSGAIVYGPQALDAATSNITTYAQTVAGPAPIGGGGGYTPFTFDPSGMPAGDYYVEFSTNATTNSGVEFAIPYFDITVATTGTPVVIPGRVFSKNWALFLPSIDKPSTTQSWFDRPFNGRFFVYTEDGFVSDINFLNSGFQPAAFNISMNSKGTGTSGDVIEDRKSLNNAQGNNVEYKIFLEDPDAVVYPSGTFGELRTDSTKLIGCDITGTYFIKIVTTQQGVVEILLDQDQATGVGIYDPGTTDRLLAIDIDLQQSDDTPNLYTRFIPWDGLDGLGNPVDVPNVSVNSEVTFSQGRYHIPVYDAEYNLNGFSSTVIRPTPPPAYILKYYYDDNNIPDASNITGQDQFNSEGCLPACHRWNNQSYGNLNTINTYWFAKQEFQLLGMNLESGCGGDRDNDGVFDVVDIDWDNDGIPNSLEFTGPDPTVDSDFDGILNYQDADFCTLSTNGVCFYLDPDRDGIPSFLDLDADNDGIPDIIEAGGQDTDGNGMADNLADIDDDGLADTYDAVDDQGNVSYTSADDCQSANGPVHNLVFVTNGVNASGDVTLIFSLTGDYGTSTSETFSLTGENNTVIGTGYNKNNSNNSTYSDCSTPAMVYSITINQSDWNTWNADNTVNITLQASTAVNFCTNRSCISATSVSYNVNPVLGTAIPNADTDNDGQSDFLDLDADNDGIADLVEVGGVDLDGNGMADDMINPLTGDTNQNGWSDFITANLLIQNDLNDPTANTDTDNIPDHLDLDADNDGLPDLVEAGGIDTNGDGRVDASLDVDQDGLADIFDNYVSDGMGGTLTNGTSFVATDNAGIWQDGASGLLLDTDGDGFNDGLDLDADNDGIPDVIETGGSDDDGDGMVDTGLAPWDADQDGLADVYDQNASDGPGNAGFSGTALVLTTAETGTPDGRVNTTETMITGGTNVINADTDLIPNHLDLDADNDGIVDILEAGGVDTNGDGLVDDFIAANPGAFDTADNDGWSPTYDGDAANDGPVTTTGDGTPLILTTDNDFNGIPESYTLGDADQDNHPNFLDIDADNDGIVDNVEAQDTPGYTLPDNMDADNDGLDDAYDNFVGFGGTGIDTDNGDAEGTENDHDGDNIPDYLDADSDNDNVPDMQEAWDNLFDGDSSVDASIGNCDGTDIDNDGLLDCFDSDTSSPLVTSYQNPVDDNGDEGVSTTAMAPTSGADPSEIYPNNSAGDGQPDWRDVIIDCATPQVYYASTEASTGTTTDYEYNGTTHVDQVDTKVVRATTYCSPGDGWFYFYNPLEPENYLFALKNAAGSPNTVPLNELVDFVEIKVEADPTNRHVVNATQANLVMERDWNIELKDTPTPGSTFDVKFYFPPAEMDALATAADDVEAAATGTVTRDFYWFGKNGGVTNSDITSSGVTGSTDISTNDPNSITDTSADLIDGTSSTSGNAKNYVTFTGLSDLSGGTAGILMTYSSNSLPVELVDFNATVKDCEVTLDWSSASEENFSHYDLERSNDGRIFESIGQQKGIGSNVLTRYQFADIHPSSTNYYRLKMVDHDGYTEYSKVVVASVDCEKAATKLAIYPNPIRSNQLLTVAVETAKGEAVLVISDLAGRIMKTVSIETNTGTNQVRLDLTDLPSGVYFMANQNERQLPPVKFLKM